MPESAKIDMNINKTIQSFAMILTMNIFCFLSSCVSLPTAQTSELSNSGKVLKGALSESFNLTTDILYEQTYTRNTKKDKSLNNYLDSTNDLNKKEFDKRIAYVAVLEAYFDALNNLASRNDSKAIRESAINLDASLMGMQQYLPVGGQSTYTTLSTGVGTASELITHYVSQGVQRKYLRLSMDKAKPAIDSICVFLKDNLSTCDNLLNTNQHSVLTGLIAVRNTDTAITQRYNWDIYIGHRVQEMKLLDHSYKTAQLIVANLPKAHAEIRTNLDAKMKFKTALTTIVSEVKDLKECYDQISSKNKGK